MKARPCGVASCPSLATPLRVFCAVHARARAFVDACSCWLCPRCATARIRGGGDGLAVADGEEIARANREACTAPDRATCADCGRFLLSPRPRKQKRGRLPVPVPVRLQFPPLR